MVIVTAIDGAVPAEILRNLNIDLVGCSATTKDIAFVRAQVARRPGAIVGIVTEHIAPTHYCHERTICIDTTAAGGNASLLAAPESG